MLLCVASTVECLKGIVSGIEFFGSFLISNTQADSKEMLAQHGFTFALSSRKGPFWESPGTHRSEPDAPGNHALLIRNKTRSPAGRLTSLGSVNVTGSYRCDPALIFPSATKLR